MKLLHEIKLIALSCLIAGVILSFIPFFLTSILIRSLVSLAAKIFRPDLENVLTAEHSSFAMGPLNKALENIIVTFTLAGEVPLDLVRFCVQRRVFDLEKSEHFKFGLLKRTWENFGGWAFWKLDKEFNLQNHVRDYDYGGRLSLPNPCYSQNLHSVLAELFQAPWDRKRSPWEILRVPNYEYNQQPCTAFVLRMDHALGDGFSISNFIKTFTNSDFAIPKLKFSERRLSIWKKIGMTFKAPYDLAKNLNMAFSAKGLMLIRPDVVGEVISVNPVVDVDTVKTIKNHFEVNYATVLYAACCGAIERALKMSGQDPPAWLKGGFIIPKRGHPGGICIHVSTTVTAWPIKCKSPVERLLKIQKNLEEITSSSVAFAYDNMAYLIGSGPQILGRFMTRHGKTYCERVGLGATLINNPVSKGPDCFEGHQFLDLTVGISTLEPSGIISDVGGLNNVQRFNFNIRRSLFATDEICANMGEYVVAELQSLLDLIV